MSPQSNVSKYLRRYDPSIAGTPVAELRRGSMNVTSAFYRRSHFVPKATREPLEKTTSPRYLRYKVFDHVGRVVKDSDNLRVAKKAANFYGGYILVKDENKKLGEYPYVLTEEFLDMYLKFYVVQQKSSKEVIS